MKIMIVGGGKVGTALSRSLVDGGHDVTLIDQNDTVLKKLTRKLDILGILGNGANYKILEEADVQACDIFFAMTEKDEVNMVAAVLAKKMGAKETVVRVRNPEYSNPYFRDHNFLDFSLIINPELLTARYMANSINFPNALSVEHFANGRVMLMEFKISPNGLLDGLSILEFRKKFQQILICAIVRDHQAIIPDGNTIIQAGDRVFVTGKRQAIIAFHNRAKARPITHVLMVGGGKIAYYLLNLLKDTPVQVKLIEADLQRAQFFSQEFPKLHVVHGDGTSKSTLLEEGVQHYQAVATLTGVDEENIITSLFVESLDGPKTITKVNRTSLLDIINDDKLSTIVTPKSIAADSMLHFVRGRMNAQDSSLEALHHIAHGKVETLQFNVVDHNRATAVPISQLAFKPDVLIMAIIRSGRAIFPTGEDQLQPGDKVIVATLQDNIHQLCDLLV